MIYFDNAATTVHKPPQVIEAVTAALSAMGNPGRGAHGGALSAARTVYDTREKLAALFGCGKPDRVAFAANATEALNTAISGLLSPGDHIIATDLEHNSVLRPLYRLEKQGAHLSFVRADPKGRVDYEDFQRLIRPETRAIVCTHASNVTGALLDIGRIGALAREKGLLFIVDAAQTAGVFPIHMGDMNIDVLCFTGHKGLLGPQGTGGLCLREGVEIHPFKVGGSGVSTYSKEQPGQMPAVLEAGTLNGHGIAGLGAALDYIGSVGMDHIRSRERSLARRFYEGVSQIGGVTVYGDFEVSPRAAVVALNIRDLDSSAVSDVLDEDYQIATRPGAHCAPRMHQALGTAEQGAVRFSFSHFNTESEVDAAISAIAEIAGS